MIVKKIKDIVKGKGLVEDPGGHWTSRRMLLERHGMGFSFNITTIFAGTATRIRYKNHVEAVYCISGRGEVETVADGVTHPIEPGTLYALDGHEEHWLRAHTDLYLACVFNPPLTGDEVHDADGSYPPARKKDSRFPGQERQG
jgi:L-ectoine synthase